MAIIWKTTLCYLDPSYEPKAKLIIFIRNKIKEAINGYLLSN